MRNAHLPDPFAVVDTSRLESYPWQIDAVYNRLVTPRLVRFLLADDPGVDQTIMSRLLTRKLMLRGDVERFLTIAAGGPVEQWQDEWSEAARAPREGGQSWDSNRICLQNVASRRCAAACRFDH